MRVRVWVRVTVVQVTGEQQFHFIGHSMGTLTYFTACNYHPWIANATKYFLTSPHFAPPNLTSPHFTSPHLTHQVDGGLWVPHPSTQHDQPLVQVDGQVHMRNHLL